MARVLSSQFCGNYSFKNDSNEQLEYGKQPPHVNQFIFVMYYERNALIVSHLKKKRLYQCTQDLVVE